ncbi:MAG: hypothetical protein KDB23_01925 [Planctomycetales bacterium]|nr:hypothetical protein [Planctomycetales bacterium]
MKNSIVYELRHGMLVIRVRRARSSRTRTYKVSVHRVYRDGELWHESTRFGADDIPLLRYLLDVAHNWILARTDRKLGDEGGETNDSPRRNKERPQ